MTEFRKVHGAGNDFILVTEAHGRDWRALASVLCHRRLGVGGDGLVVSERVSAATYAVTCYNSDGSVASMCGNALRCTARCAAEDYQETHLTLLMCGVSHDAVVDGAHVSVSVTVGPVTPGVLAVDWDGRRLEFAAVNTGTDHVVAFADDLDGDVAGLGERVRYDEVLAPAGANVNIARVADSHTLQVRTYERGVEAETLSCGSGAVAAVAVARHAGTVTDGPVSVRNEAGTALDVGPVGDPREGTVWLTGPAQVVYRGELA